MFNKELLTEFIDYLENKKPISFSGIIGFDGFVDEIVEVVDKRQSVDKYQKFNTMSDYIDRLSLGVNHSLNMELVPIKLKLGGNAPIMANSMKNHGADIHFIGALGKEKIHFVFEEFVKDTSYYSICDSGWTNALEFADGKIMMGKIESLKEMTWENIIKIIGEQKLLDLLKEIDFLATVNWTMLPYMNDIWNNFIALMKSHNISRKYLFIDLADFQKRLDTDCLQAFELISKLQDCFDVHLGVNMKEMKQIAQLFSFANDDEDDQEILNLCQNILNKLKISSLVTHSHKKVYLVNTSIQNMIEVPYTKTPVISTGAGDHFNAGYFTGVLLGLNPNQAVILGCLNSNFYIRTAISPNLEQIINFANLCVEDKQEEIRNIVK